MRVVAGALGGRRLFGDISLRQTLRPTADRIREATFNALESMGAIKDSNVVDLFAGTGACGIEALSRGAATAVFVDNDRRALDLIRRNLETTGLSGKIVRADVSSFLAGYDRPADLAFADPPYAFRDWTALLELIDAPLAVCESNRPVAPGASWVVVRERSYGGTTVTIMERGAI